MHIIIRDRETYIIYKRRGALRKASFQAAIGEDSESYSQNSLLRILLEQDGE